MKKQIVLLTSFAFATLIPYASFAQSSAVPFTLEDRDRIIQMQIKMDERFESIQKEMNTRFESMNDKMDKLYTLLYFILGGVFGLIGLIMWDRRSYIKPVKEDIMALQNVLKHYAKKQPELADILRSHGLL